MHAFVYASLILLLKSPLSVIAKPIASGDDLSADYSLFSGGDGSSTGTGDESDLFAATDNLSDLSGAGSSCSAEVGLLDGDDSLLGLDPSNDLVVRELDDNLFVAGKTPTTCVDKPVGQNQNPEPELDIPKLGLPANSNEQNNKCGGYNGRSLLACCDYSTTESPTNCQAWPYASCLEPKWDYCCESISASLQGAYCKLLETPLQRGVRQNGFPLFWDEMPVVLPPPAPEYVPLLQGPW